MHNGKIVAHSAGAGQGASFTVTFPLYHFNPVNPIEILHSAHALRLDGVKVLVIEDSADTRELLGIVLNSYGCQVALADSVARALELILTQKPEVIISDIGLPEADGYELARRLRQTPGFERIPMIALTGYAMDADRQKAYENGFDRHLPKPIDPETLIRTIYELHLREASGPLFHSTVSVAND